MDIFLNDSGHFLYTHTSVILYFFVHEKKTYFTLAHDR